MAAWRTTLRDWWRGDEPDAEPLILGTTVEVAPAAGLTHHLTHNLTHTRLPPTAQCPQTAALDKAALLAERVKLPLRKQGKKAPVSNAEYQARHRAKAMAADREGYLRLKREAMAALRAKRKAEKAVAAQAVAAGVIDLGAVRAKRAVPQVTVEQVTVDQVEQQVQRALPEG